MVSPRSFYEHRLSDRKRELVAVRSRYDIIAWSRLISFLAACALAALTLWRQWHLSGWLATALPALVFMLLVIVHSRVARRVAQTEAAVAYCERALRRLDGGWVSFPSRGDSFLDDAHPYALDLDVFGPRSLFQYLSDARTPLGERALASWLCAAASPSEIVARQSAIKELRSCCELREAIAVAATCVSSSPVDPDPLLSWTDKAGRSARPVWLVIFSWLSPAVLIASISFSSVLGIPAWTALVVFAVNLMVLAAERRSTDPVIEVISKRSEELARLSAVLAVIERQGFEAPLLREMCARLRASGIPASAEIRNLSRLVSFLDARANGAFRAIIGPALLWDIHWVGAIERWQRRSGASLRGWLDALGFFEAAVSLATFAFDHPSYAFPEVVSGSLCFEAEGIGHPLLDDATRVVNNVSLPGPGSVLLVTGSNMSGKSTLLRSIGVAAVLAMAGGPVCARGLRIGLCDVQTSMRVNDSLRDGISRFYAELLKLKRTVQAAESSRPVLFLLDEILHGTNSRERHIGARSIIGILVRLGAMGAATTHDLALADLEHAIEGSVRNVHFEEQVVEGKMTFDYVLRDGVVQSGNALRWMRLVGLDVAGE